MLSRKLDKNIFEYSLILIILINAYLILSVPLSLFDQSINIVLSIAIYEYFKSNEIDKKKELITFL